MVFSALKNKNYRLYFTGQFLSISGLWMQTVALSWLVYQISHSSTLLGLVSFCTQIPAFLLSPVAGVVADRGNRRALLIRLQWLALSQASLLAILTFTHLIQTWHILVLAALAGMISAFDMTARYSFVSDMVKKEEAPQAVAMNSILINGARIIGPSIAAVIIAKSSEGWCFLINALTYLPVVYGLKQMKLQPQASAPVLKKNIQESIREGFCYVLQNRFLLKLILLSGLISFFSQAYFVLLPAISDKQLNGNAHTYALLTAFVGSGAILGAILYGSERKTAPSLKKSLLISTAFMGLGMILLALSKSLPLSMLAVFVIGMHLMSTYPRINTAIQDAAHPHLLGRVLSLYTMTFLAGTPLGSLLAGWLGDKIGPSLTVSLAGAALIIASGSIGVPLNRILKKR